MSAGCITRARKSLVLSERLELSSHGAQPCASASCATTALWRNFCADGETRTLNLLILNQAPLPIGLRRREEWWTRLDSNQRPRPPQGRALIPLSYGSVKFWRKVWESNPQEFSGSDGFQDHLAFRVPNLPRAKSVIVKNDEGRELEAPEDTLRRTLLPRMARPSGLSQSTRGRAIQRRHPCPHLSLHRYFSYQTTKRAGGFNREAHCPLRQFS